MSASRYRLAAVVMALVLAGCGQTGDLVLPDRAEQPVTDEARDQASDADRKRKDDDKDQD